MPLISVTFWFIWATRDLSGAAWWTMTNTNIPLRSQYTKAKPIVTSSIWATPGNPRMTSCEFSRWILHTKTWRKELWCVLRSAKAASKNQQQNEKKDGKMVSNTTPAYCYKFQGEGSSMVGKWRWRCRLRYLNHTALCYYMHIIYALYMQCTSICVWTYSLRSFSPFHFSFLRWKLS